MSSENYEFEYCNRVNANEASNKASITRQRKMIQDIREQDKKITALQARIDILHRAVGFALECKDLCDECRYILAKTLKGESNEQVR